MNDSSCLFCMFTSVACEFNFASTFRTNSKPVQLFLLWVLFLNKVEVQVYLLN